MRLCNIRSSGQQRASKLEESHHNPFSSKKLKMLKEMRGGRLGKSARLRVFDTTTLYTIILITLNSKSSCLHRFLLIIRSERGRRTAHYLYPKE